MAAAQASGPAFIMPIGASAAGEAFELLVTRYLREVAGLGHLAAPFYTRLRRGKWVQYDGLFSRDDGARVVLEAKFYRTPVGLRTPGVVPRIAFAAESGFDCVLFASRKGFARDIMRAKTPIAKSLLSWKTMQRKLARHSSGLVTAGLDTVEKTSEGYAALSGAVLRTREGPEETPGGEGFAFLTAPTERWLRRLPASPVDINPEEPPRKRIDGQMHDILDAWTIEDSLRGFAPAAPELLIKCTRALKDGPLHVTDAWKALWRAGYRGRKGGLKNALDDLLLIGVAEKFRSARGLFYGLATHTQGMDAGEAVAAALLEWPAMRYFAAFDWGAADKNVISAGLSKRFARFGGLARSLYNPAKVGGLMALARHFAQSTSISNPSYPSAMPAGSDA